MFIKAYRVNVAVNIHVLFYEKPVKWHSTESFLILL